MLQTQLADRRTSPATMVVADYGLAQTLSQVYLTGFSLQITCHGDTAPSIGKNEDYEEIEKDINEQVRGIISQSYLSEQESFVQKLIRISEANNGEHLSELSELPQSLYSPISREFIPSNHWDKLLNSMEQRNRFLQQKFGQRKKVEV